MEKKFLNKDLLKAIKNERLPQKSKETLINNYFKKGADINCTDENGDSALLYAVKQNNEELTNFLLGFKGINLDLQNKQGENALISAVKNENIKLVQQLINNGANPNLKEKLKGQYTAMTYACNIHNTQIAKILIKSEKLDLDAIVNCDLDKNKETALIYAIKKGCKNIAKILIENGADVNARDTEGYTALMRAITEKNGSKKPEVYDEIIDNLLTNPKINVNLQSNNIFDPKLALNLCDYKDTKTIKKLLKHGANFSILKTIPKMQKDNEIEQAIENEKSSINMELIKACENNNINKVKELLNNPKININYVISNKETKQKETPLMIACKNGNKEIIKLLLEKNNIAIDFYSNVEYIKGLENKNDKKNITTNVLNTIKDKEILNLLRDHNLNLKNHDNKNYYNYLGIPTEKTKINITEIKQDDQTTTRYNSAQQSSESSSEHSSSKINYNQKAYLKNLGNAYKELFGQQELQQ